MKIENAINYLEQCYKLGRKLGLENMKLLLEELDNPEENFKIIHVAGTNGKGSVCSMLSHLILNSGYNVGQYSSPHLIHYNERFRFNNIIISDDDFVKTINQVKKAVDRMINKGYNHPTEFEILTAMAFVYFSDKNADYVLLEVGLGGRLDATNIINNPILTIITTIGIDHIKFLGDNIISIASEKAGIIKKGANLVISPQKEKEVINYLEGVAKEKKADKIILAEDINLKIKILDLEKTIIIYNGKLYDFSLIGYHQIDNLKTVLSAFELLDLKISDNKFRESLNSFSWPGRMEKINEKPLVIIDGAHNPSAATALLETIKKDKRSKIAIFGMLEDKNYKSVLDILHREFKYFIITEPVGAVSANINDISKYLEEKGNIYFIEKNHFSATKKALQLQEKDDIIIGFGSFYLIGELKKDFRKIFK